MREREEKRGGQLYCIRVLTISSLPHHHTRHKMATSFLHAAMAVAVGVGGYEDTSISSHASVTCSSTVAQPFLIFIYTSAEWPLKETQKKLSFFFSQNKRKSPP